MLLLALLMLLAGGASPAYALDAPTGATASAGDGSAATSVDAPSDPTLVFEYRVYRKVGTEDWPAEATHKVPPPGDGSRPAFSDAPLVNGTPVRYRWTVVDLLGTESLPAETDEVTPTAPPPPPPLPAPASFAGTPGDGVAKLSWSAVSGATDYVIARGDGATWTTTLTQYEVPGTNGTSASYTVRARDADRNLGTESSSVEVTPEAPTPPPPPPPPPPPTPTPLPAPVLTGTAGNGSVALSWGAVRGAARYVVSASNGRTWSTRQTGITLPAANGVAVTYTVHAVDSGGRAGHRSNPRTLTPRSPAPLPDRTAPPAPKLTVKGGQRSARLSYPKPASDVAGYLVYQRKAGRWVFLGQTLGTATTVSGLAPGRPVAFAVRAIDLSGNRSPLSSSAAATPYDRVGPAALRRVRGKALRGRVQVSWLRSRADDHRAYRLQVRSSSRRGWRTKAVRGTSWRSGRLSCRRAHAVRVSDVDTSGNRGAWRTVRVRPRCR